MSGSTVRVSASALLGNLRAFRAALPSDVRVIAVVKGNAYGHGQEEVSSVLESAVDFFQLNDTWELERLRRSSGTPALILGHVPPDELPRLLRLGRAVPGVGSAAEVWALDAAARDARVTADLHLAVDARFGREGARPEDLASLLDALRSCRHVRVTGAYAHYSSADDREADALTRSQRETFDAALRHISDAGHRDLLVHSSATASTLAGPPLAPYRGAVRLGLGLYGLYPSETRAGALPGLTPVLRWTAPVAAVKRLSPGDPVGYGAGYVASRPGVTALLPVGYAEGLPRRLTGVGRVEIGGVTRPLVGKISMNWCVADVSDGGDVRPGDECLLVGGTGDVSADAAARRSGTINYEVTTRIPSSVRRFLDPD